MDKARENLSCDDDVICDDYESVDIFNEDEREELQKTTTERDKALASELQLEYEWVFWYDERTLRKGMTERAYESNVKRLGKFATVESFWRYWNNLEDASRFPEGTNLRIFKVGIKPMWEDPINVNGGKWMIRIRKEKTHEVWSKLVLALIGEQFEYSEGLCGMVLSVRPRGNAINIWNKSGDNEKEIEFTTEQLRNITGLEFAYQLHSASVEWNEKKQKKKEMREMRNSLDRKTSSGEFERAPLAATRSLNITRQKSDSVLPPPASVDKRVEVNERKVKKEGETNEANIPKRETLVLPEFVTQRWGDVESSESEDEVVGNRFRKNWADVHIPPRSALSEIIEEEDRRKKKEQESKEKKKKKSLRKTISVSMSSRDLAPPSPSQKKGKSLKMSASLDLPRNPQRKNNIEKREEEAKRNKRNTIRRSTSGFEEEEVRQSPKIAVKKEDWRRDPSRTSNRRQDKIVEIPFDEDLPPLRKTQRLRNSLTSTREFEEGEDANGRRNKKQTRGKGKGRREKGFRFDILHGILLVIVFMLLGYLYITLPPISIQLENE